MGAAGCSLRGAATWRPQRPAQPNSKRRVDHAGRHHGHAVLACARGLAWRRSWIDGAPTRALRTRGARWNSSRRATVPAAMVSRARPGLQAESGLTGRAARRTHRTGPGSQRARTAKPYGYRVQPIRRSTDARPSRRACAHQCAAAHRARRPGGEMDRRTPRRAPAGWPPARRACGL
ncbi:hypothetical protein ACU4GD_22765 [Cupriavidus basilensis]